MNGRLVAAADGVYLDADDAALGLLGLSLDELRTHRVGDFAGPYRDISRNVWQRYASRGLPLPTGEASLHPPERPPVRLLYQAVAPAADGSYELLFEVIGTDVGPPIVDDLHAVLEEWRASERGTGGPGGQDQGPVVQEEADALRRLYGLGTAARLERDEHAERR